jgi:hypothetical protein
MRAEGEREQGAVVFQEHDALTRGLESVS